MKSKFYPVVFILFGLGFWLPGSGKPVNRIVSLAPSVTTNIYFLEAQKKLVGCTSYCVQAVANHKEIVASAVKVNIEKVVSLKPDIVISTTMTDPETVEMLRRFNIEVELFPTAKSFGELCSQTIRLGKLIGAEEKAGEIVTQCKAKVKTLSAMNPGKNKSRIFFQIGAKPLFTVIPDTYMNDFITLAGGTNIVSNTKTGIIGRESVVASNPDVIFIATMGIVGDEEKRVWESYAGLNATKNKKIFIIDSEEACTPTPVTFVHTLENIVKLMNLK